MKYLASIFGIIFASGTMLCAQEKTAGADLANGQGQKVGSAELAETPAGVKIAVAVSGLSPGLHGFHIHAVGKCEGPDFKTAGGHFNPYGKKHGLKNPEGAHAGDMQNLEVGADGSGKAEVLDKQVTLGEGANSLFHEGGTAIVIHASPDDDMTDPAGNAGARIACGIVTK